MSTRQRITRLSRRDFLKMGALTGGVALTAAAGRTSLDLAKGAEADQSGHQGHAGGPHRLAAPRRTRRHPVSKTRARTMATASAWGRWAMLI